MALPWKPYVLDCVNRLLEVETEDGSARLRFDMTVQADGVEHSLVKATIEAGPSRSVTAPTTHTTTR